MLIVCDLMFLEILLRKSGDVVYGDCNLASNLKNCGISKLAKHISTDWKRARNEMQIKAEKKKDLQTNYVKIDGVCRSVTIAVLIGYFMPESN